MERMATFVEEIVHPDFEMVHRLLENYLLEIYQEDRMIKLKEFTGMVESWQHGLNQMADGDMEVKLCCTRFKGNSSMNQD
eukprot:6520656-Ditylum_brightwellii.AAC.1